MDQADQPLSLSEGSTSPKSTSSASASPSSASSSASAAASATAMEETPVENPSGLSGVMTLYLSDFHTQTDSFGSSEKVQIGPVNWVTTTSVLKDTYVKDNGHTTCWYRCCIETSALLPPDTKFYCCMATIEQGWYMKKHAPMKFQDRKTFLFTNSSPRYRHRFTFDLGLRPPASTDMTVFTRVTLDHGYAPVRPVPYDFSTPSSPFHDLKIVCGAEKKEIYTNKSLLAISSPVFSALLYGEFLESNSESIALPDTSDVEMTELLRHIYPNIRHPLNESNVAILLRLADRYLMDAVTHECEKYLIYYNSDRCTDDEDGSKVISWEQRAELATQFRLQMLKKECVRRGYTGEMEKEPEESTSKESKDGE